VQALSVLATAGEADVAAVEAAAAGTAVAG